MATRTKNIILVIAVLFVIAALTAFYLYNKGPRDVRSSKGLAVDAISLYQAYLSDSVSARKKYAGEILAVSGQVADVSANQQGETLVLLQTGEAGAFINCTLEKDSKAPEAGINLTIKGICSGIGQGEPELGIKGDVYLTRCIINE